MRKGTNCLQSELHSLEGRHRHLAGGAADLRVQGAIGQRVAQGAAEADQEVPAGEAHGVGAGFLG